MKSLTEVIVYHTDLSFCHHSRLRQFLRQAGAVGVVLSSFSADYLTEMTLQILCHFEPYICARLGFQSIVNPSVTTISNTFHSLISTFRNGKRSRNREKE